MPVVVVTGGSSGIGLSTATRFVKAGWQAFICGRDRARLEQACFTINQSISTVASDHPVDDATEVARAVSISADVRSRQSIEGVVEHVAALGLPIDAWVNSAGIAPMAPIDELSDDDLEQTFRTNCASVFYATRSVWPVMSQQESGVIVNVSSLASTDPFPGFSVYGASKAWVNLFSKATAQEGQARGIRVFAVCPGAVETPLLRDLFPDFPHDQAMLPNQVAETIWHLCQPGCDVASGSSIEIHHPDELSMD